MRATKMLREVFNQERVFAKSPKCPDCGTRKAAFGEYGCGCPVRYTKRNRKVVEHLMKFHHVPLGPNEICP